MAIPFGWLNYFLAHKFLSKVEQERNDRSVQQTIINSLRATLTEADRQLEQASALEKQLHAIQASRHVCDQHLVRALHETEEPHQLVDTSLETKDNVNLVWQSVEDLHRPLYDTPANVSGDFLSNHSEVAKQKDSINPFVISPSRGQVTYERMGACILSTFSFCVVYLAHPHKY